MDGDDEEDAEIRSLQLLTFEIKQVTYLCFLKYQLEGATQYNSIAIGMH